MDPLDRDWLMSQGQWARWQQCRAWVCQFPTMDAYMAAWAAREGTTVDDLDRDQFVYLLDWWEWAHTGEPGARPPPG